MMGVWIRRGLMAGMAVAVLGVLAVPAWTAVTTSVRVDPVDVAAEAGVTDLVRVAWSLDEAGGAATVEVAFSESAPSGQQAWVWADHDGDGKADLVVEFARTSAKAGEAEAWTVTEAVEGCHVLQGVNSVGFDQSAPVSTADGVSTMSLSLKYSPPGGSFRWAAFGSTPGQNTPHYDYVPDSANPDPDKPSPDDRTCKSPGAGWRVALDKGAHFPDRPPTASFATDQAEPRDGRPFKLIATASDEDGQVVRYDWEFGPGEAFDDATGPEVNLERPTGTYDVGLRVTDDDGLTTVVRQQVVVQTLDLVLPVEFFSAFRQTPLWIVGKPEPPDAITPGNTPPVLRLSVRPRRPGAGKLARLDASRSSDGKARPERFRWDLDGDGEFDDGFGPRVRYRWATAGRHRVSVQAADEDFTLSRSIKVRVRGKAVPAVAALVRKARPASSPKTSFERGLGGWKRAGKAFGRKPVRRKRILVSRELETRSRVGGSYADIAVPSGAHGRGWMTSFSAGRVKGLSVDAAGDVATGVLVSPRFRVTKRYLSFRVGGDDDADGKQRSTQRVELWTGRGRALRRSLVTPAGENERMRQVTLDLRKLRGRQGVLAVVDASTQGHINVDGIVVSSGLPRAEPAPPLSGFFDTHTHGFAHQGFGGLGGIRTIMGVPGGAHRDYYTRDGRANAARYLADMRDSPTHNGGVAYQALFPLVHRFFPSIGENLHQQMHVTEIYRAYAGGLRLISSLAVTNEALEHAAGTVTAIDGGPPRGDVFSGPFEDSSSRSENKIQTTPGKPVIEAHVLGMRQLERLNSDWMEIVYSPEQAYQAISNDKLAVVLGTEVDDLGRLDPVHLPTAEAEVDWLWRLGIRQVTPVHAADNEIGGAGIFQDLYNTTNDLLRRPERHLRRARIADDLRDGRRRPTFFRAEQSWSCAPRPGFVPPRGECVSWTHAPGQMSFALDFNAFLPLLEEPLRALTGVRPRLSQFHPAVHTAGDEHRPWYTFNAVVGGGHRNLQNLKPYGRQYIEALMRRGMLIDVEHMSDRTIDDILDPSPENRGPVWNALPPGRAGCAFRQAPPARGIADPCFAQAYPVMSSHTSFRAQSLDRFAGRSAVKDYWPREFERTPAQIEYIRRSGGTIAPVTGHDPVERPATVARALDRPSAEISSVSDSTLRTNAERSDLNDCAGSSKSWLQAYLYGVQKMRGKGVGISTDMAIVGSTAPRYDPPGTDPRFPKSCPAAAAASNLDDFNLSDLILTFHRSGPDGVMNYLAGLLVASRRAEEERYPQFDRAGQRTRVEYTNSQIPRRGNRVWQHRTPAGRALDFNTLGVKTYGALPDLIQDAVNLGVAREDLLPLLTSVQSYVDMWDKAYRVVGCDRDYARCEGGAPVPLPPSVCRNTCPDDPGRGNLLDPAGRTLELYPEAAVPAGGG